MSYRLGIRWVCALGAVLVACACGTAEGTCEPDCDGKVCGDDGCGGSCGECAAGKLCVAGTCQTSGCEPDCAGKECGPDGCGGSCGACYNLEGAVDDSRCVEGLCQCVPDCSDNECGPDGCGGSCGHCYTLEGALDDSLCLEGVCHPGCTPQCAGKECGNDGCGGTCGTCPAAAPICQDFICEAGCQPDCQGKECGDDGCGGSCGTCPAAAPICEDFICQVDCQPDCQGKECGDDGCGGACGDCSGSEPCFFGHCFDVPEPGCTLHQHGQGVYAFCDGGDSVTWLKANQYCMAWGGGLVVFNTGAEKDWVTGTYDGVEFWVGLTDLESEGNFEWLDGSPFADEEDWCDSQPDDAGGKEECAEWGHDAGSCFNDCPCDAHNCKVTAYVCELDPDCTPSCVAKECGSNGCGGTCGMCPQGAVCYGGECKTIYWVDATSGLTWQVEPSGAWMTWAGAKSYCSNLELAGGGWHLPTISELRTLIRGCAATESGGSCGVADDCLANDYCWDGSCMGCSFGDGPADGCYWPEEMKGGCAESWSSSPVEDYGSFAWTVDFRMARPGWGVEVTRGLMGVVRCVR